MNMTSHISDTDSDSYSNSRSTTSTTRVLLSPSNPDTQTALLSSFSSTDAEVSSAVHINIPLGAEEEDDHRTSASSDLDGLWNFGGVQRIAEVLGTNLEEGNTIGPGDDHGSPNAISMELAPSSTSTRGSFFGFLIKYCKSTNILLLFLGATLSIGFGIVEEGLKTGWLEGAIIMIAIIILVVAPSIRDVLRDQKLHKPLETQVEIIRDGNNTTHNQTSLLVQLEKVANRTQIAGLSISTLILVVLFLRFMLGKKHTGSDLPDIKKTMESKKIMDIMEKIVMNLSGKISILTTPLTILLLGTQEPVTLVIILTIVYWRKKMFPDKALDVPDLLACIKMASVNYMIICTDELQTDGLENSCCKEIKDAVTAYEEAGVKILLTSEDNVLDLEDTARKYGLKLPYHSVISRLDGEYFRNCLQEDTMYLVDKNIVMGNSSPSDTLLLVQCLKRKGNVVAMLGTRTIASPALKEADVRITMRFSSSEMAMEINPELIIPIGNFCFLVNFTSRGRCIYNNILKYIQFELAMAIAGMSIALITTASLGHTPIAGVQLIMANLVMNLLGGLALLSEPPTDEVMHKPPVSPAEPLISKLMWRNILSQASYQTAILVTFYVKGRALLDISEQLCKSIVFNSFALCQVFNLLNSREPEKTNVFKGLDQSPCFGVAVFFILIMQIAFIEVENIFMGNAMLINLVQWGVALLIGSGSLLVDSAVKCTSSFIINKTRPLLLGFLHHHHDADSNCSAVTVSVPCGDSSSVSCINADGLVLLSITVPDHDSSSVSGSNADGLELPSIIVPNHDSSSVSGINADGLDLPSITVPHHNSSSVSGINADGLELPSISVHAVDNSTIMLVSKT
ncbi:hypothetical protein FNV43_RR07946 [Rhamnella rubrinervis]|uniref:Cation-transporting P-type ATPase C-terminal domain-containing protein n=1 Tax=Rhamnella rubrinervis TaxID=2594499 RepID=A0A8K0MNG9_9ROSA|nr:hypothetical protein FNV43_RR07946 [Rhamnella rubrinervis]